MAVMEGYERNMTFAEIGILTSGLKTIFDVVRLVDVTMTTQYSVSPAGEITWEPYQCYAVWNYQRRCENCISAKAFSQKCQMTKFEFIDDQIFFVVSKYVEVENEPYMLEMVMKVNDQTLLGAYGQNQFIQTINAYNKKLYTDTLTGAYNRQYLNEQLSGLSKINAVAMIDVDNFKMVNDRFGHAAGDLVLQEIVKLLRSLTRSSDAVVRYGGDEFIVTFHGITEQTLRERLESMRKAVYEFRASQYPDLRVSLSIGAVLCTEKAIAHLEEADQALYEAKKEKNKVEMRML